MLSAPVSNVRHTPVISHDTQSHQPDRIPHLGRASRRVVGLQLLAAVQLVVPGRLQRPATATARSAYST